MKTQNLLLPFLYYIDLPLILYLISTHLKPALAATTSSSYDSPQDNITINCGHHGIAVSQSNRTWAPDVDDDNGLSPFISSNYLNSSLSASATTQDYAPQIPYMTARLSRSQFTYQTPISTNGPKFVRLYFHPTSYSNGFDAAAATFFSVTVNGRYTLLNNFSASLTAQSLNQTYFFKEFSLPAAVSEKIVSISFVPSPGSFSFVNGIEVVSMPSDLYLNRRDINIVSASYQTLSVDNTSTAMETVYRLNVNGQSISPVDDAGGMFRSWFGDNDEVFGAATGEDPFNTGIGIKYVKVPTYTAPEVMYETARSMGLNKTVNENYNLTWMFRVDSGFVYLVRLHFCEIAPEITQINQRVFEIFINNQTADDQMDIIAHAGASGVPIYREFIAIVSGGDNGGGKQDLWLALHPAPKFRTQFSDALLNGLEIFKINRSDGSLAGTNPDPVPNPTGPDFRSSKPPKAMLLLPVTASVLGSAVIVSSLLYFFYWRRTLAKNPRVSRRSRGGNGGGTSRWWWWFPFSASGSEFTKTQDLPWDLCRHLSLNEIRSATDDFCDARVIGVGGFGKVYKGAIDLDVIVESNKNDRTSKLTTVAIKRLNPSSQQGAHEFRTEIEMLSQLRHRHLVSLIGYCEDEREMILIYDHMAHGALRDYLYSNSSTRLPWKQRLEICVGASRGLHYLHTGAKHPIIHRDVKTTNILLDENWVAKVSDFGLSRVGPSNVSRTHVSTEVKGSFGYLDPEYYRRQALTDKSDVYSFGVVLFETLCGRAPLDKDLAKDEMCLSEWARAHHRNGLLDQIVDPFLKDQIAPECLRTFGEVAYNCLLDHGMERPSMAEVLGSLEMAMQLQENAEEESRARGKAMNCGDHQEERESNIRAHSVIDVSTAINGGGWMGDPDLGMSGSVFSELMSPKGR